MRTKHNLGSLYSKNPCKMKAAEDMLLRALDGYQTIYGPDHEFVVITTGALGLLYHSHDRWEEAEGMYLSALDVSQRCSAHEGAFHLRCHLGMLFEERSMFERQYSSLSLPQRAIRTYLGQNINRRLIAWSN